MKSRRSFFVSFFRLFIALLTPNKSYIWAARGLKNGHPVSPQLMPSSGLYRHSLGSALPPLADVRRNFLTQALGLSATQSGDTPICMLFRGANRLSAVVFYSEYTVFQLSSSGRERDHRLYVDTGNSMPDII